MQSILVDMVLPVLFAFAVAAELAVAAEAVPPQAIPGCTDHCGNLTIPYPFGIEPGCYMTADFYVNCNTSTEPPFATWEDSTIPITNISLADGEMQITQYIAYDCYDSQGVTEYNRQFIWLPSSYFTISRTRNKFNAVGCDTYALFRGYGAGEGESLFSGCMSLCKNRDSLERSCSGFGCCKTDIPSGLSNYTVTLNSFYNHTYVQDFNPCSYAFIVEEGKFKFSPNTSFQELSNIEKLPMILNWEIGQGLCDEVEKKRDFACKAKNSRCVNRTISNERSAYFCQCQAGYQGNPYLPDGCQDIDECKVNPCTHGTCQNLPGSYSCLCDRGYNPISNGTNCVQDIFYNIRKNNRRRCSCLLYH